MPSISLRNVRKNYGNAAPTIAGLDLEIEDGEFLVLVGPSGCGKSTLLRMIAGLLELDGGRIFVDNKDVSGLDARQRRVAFMFQTYALYPHMSIEQNIAFPLVAEKLRWYHYLPGISSLAIRRFAADPEVARRVDGACGALDLDGLRRQKPKALSGGQRQRAALARAIVRDPSIFLLDEPLSNLDAKLRVQIRSELVALQKRLGKTFVYVTHDQVEAMTMAHRVAILDRGMLQQIGTPQDVYDHPANLFVARFIGSPEINIVSPATIGRPDDRTTLLGVRPSHVNLSRDAAAGLPGRVVAVEDLGAEHVYAFTLDSDPARTTLHSVSHVDLDLLPGDRASITFDLAAAVTFDRKSGLRKQPAVEEIQ